MASHVFPLCLLRRMLRWQRVAWLLLWNSQCFACNTYTYIYIYIFFWPWSLWFWFIPQPGQGHRRKTWSSWTAREFPKVSFYCTTSRKSENRLYTFSQVSTQAYLILQLQQEWSKNLQFKAALDCSPILQEGRLILVGCKWPSAGWALANYQEISDVWQNQINKPWILLKPRTLCPWKTAIFYVEKWLPHPPQSAR